MSNTFFQGERKIFQGAKDPSYGSTLISSILTPF